LEGWISVLATLKAGYRTIHQIYIQKAKHDPNHQLVMRHARNAGVPVTFIPQAELQRFAQSRSHGGMIALVGTRRYQPLSSLGIGAETPFVAMLDGVEDPFNYGQAIRALYAAGAHGLIRRTRSWEGAEGVITRASAGATELMPTAVVESPLEAAEHFKTRSVQIVCTSSAPSHHSIYEVDLRRPLLLMIGGERRGIMRSILQEADLRVRIPYGGSFQHALDITSATAILAFEVMRQRAATSGPAGEIADG
jgi:23S rRNA (guanosine2251-2'-O)-methyltransferase